LAPDRGQPAAVRPARAVAGLEAIRRRGAGRPRRGPDPAVQGRIGDAQAADPRDRGPGRRCGSCQGVTAMTPAEAVERLNILLAHAWMIRTFLKHADEIQEDEELLSVPRTLFDSIRAV